MNQIPNLISVKEFTDRMNASTDSPIGEAAIYQMVKTPGFPALVIGNRFYILIDKVQDWMERQYTQKAALEPKSDCNEPFYKR